MVREVLDAPSKDIAVQEEDSKGAEAEPDSNILSLRKYPEWLPYLLAFLTIGAGVFCSISSTWMNKQKAPTCNGCEKDFFIGAMLQTQQMFAGEALALVVWLLDTKISRGLKKVPLFDFVKDRSELKSDRTGKWYYWSLCASCDFIATLSMNTAYQYTFAATVEMNKNFMVVMAALFQVVLIRKAVVRHQWLGVSSITLAMILTAVPALLNPDEDNVKAGTASHTIIGVLLAIGGTTVQAFQLLCEEWFFRKGRYPPVKALGAEGCTGLVLTCCAWPIYQYSKAEDVTRSWYQLTHSKALTGILLLYLPLGTTFNLCGLGATKLAGGLLRSVCFASRAPLVWIVSMIVGWQGFDYFSLASSLVFAIGFTVYCNFFGSFDHSQVGVWLRKPVPCFCTNPELDAEPPNIAHPEELKKIEAHPEELKKIEADELMV